MNSRRKDIYIYIYCFNSGNVNSSICQHLNLGVPLPKIHAVVSCEYSILPVLDSCVTLLANISCVSEVTPFVIVYKVIPMHAWHQLIFLANYLLKPKPDKDRFTDHKNAAGKL